MRFCCIAQGIISNLLRYNIMDNSTCVYTHMIESLHCTAETGTTLWTNIVLFFFLVLNFFCFLWSYLWHMEVPGLGVQSELQLPAYATATAISDLSCICDLHHSSWQQRILDPLSEARDRSHTLMVPSWIHFTAPRQELPVNQLYFNFKNTSIGWAGQFTQW